MDKFRGLNFSIILKVSQQLLLHLSRRPLYDHPATYSLTDLLILGRMSCQE